MKWRQSVWVLFLVLSGCAHKPPMAPTGLEPSTFWEEQRAREKRVFGLSARVGVRYQGPRESVSGRGVAWLASSSQLHLELRDPLGRAQYVAHLEGARFTAWYPTQKLALVDKIGGQAYLQRVLELDAGFSTLQRLLVGLVPEGASGGFSSWTWDAAAESYLGKIRARQGEISLWVHPRLAVPIRILWIRGEEKIDARYEDFEKGIAGEFAHSVEVELQRAGSRVSMEWISLSHLETKAAPKLSLPLGTEIRNLP